MGILSKTRFEASQAVFWALSECPELKLAKKSCGVPVDGALHRKKNLKSVLTSSFCFPSSFCIKKINNANFIVWFFLFAGVINLIPFTLARKAFGEAFRIR